MLCDIRELGMERGGDSSAAAPGTMLFSDIGILPCPAAGEFEDSTAPKVGAGYSCGCRDRRVCRKALDR